MGEPVDKLCGGQTEVFGVQCGSDVDIQFMILDHFRPSVAKDQFEPKENHTAGPNCSTKMQNSKYGNETKFDILSSRHTDTFLIFN